MDSLDTNVEQPCAVETMAPEFLSLEEPAMEVFSEMADLCHLIGDNVMDSVAPNVGLYLECTDDDNALALPASLALINAELNEASPTKDINIPQAINIPNGHRSSYRLSFPDDSEAEKRTPCELCCKTFTRKTLLLDHLGASHGIRDLYRCKSCTYKGQKYRDFMKHMKRKHPNEAILDCLDIDHNHRETKRSKDSGKSSDSPLDSSNPVLSKIPICTVCSKAFKTKKSLLDHKRIHVESRAHKCTIPECLKTFKTSSALNEHKTTVHGARVYKCTREGCTKAYAFRRDLAYHSRTHESNLRCLHPGCNKLFRDTYNLEIHTRTHTGDKPQSCTICDYKCVQKSSLSWHMKSKHPAHKMS